MMDRFKTMGLGDSMIRTVTIQPRRGMSMALDQEELMAMYRRFIRRIPSRRQTAAEMKTRHRKWPLGTEVIANTPIGRLPGRVHKHWRLEEVAAGCSIEFFGYMPEPVDLGDANGARWCHVISFRNLKRVAK